MVHQIDEEDSADEDGSPEEEYSPDKEQDELSPLTSNHGTTSESGEGELNLGLFSAGDKSENPRSPRSQTLSAMKAAIAGGDVMSKNGKVVLGVDTSEAILDQATSPSKSLQENAEDIILSLDKIDNAELEPVDQDQ